MDQRRVLLAVVLSLAVVVLYQRLVVQPRLQSASPETVPMQPTGTTLPEGTRPDRAPAAQPNGDNLSFEHDDSTSIVVETDVLRATLTSRGGRLASLALKQFRRSVDADSPPLELVEQGTLLPLTVMLDATQSDASVAYRPNVTSLNLAPDATGEIVFSGTTQSGLVLEKHVRFLGNAYVMDVEVHASGQAVPRSVSLVLPHLEREGVKAAGGNATETAVVLSEGKITETKLVEGKIDELKPQSAGGARWVAFTVPFFAAAVLAPTPGGGVASVEHVGSRPLVRMEQPLEGGVAAFKVFMGPKSKEVLADAGFDLSRLLDFGWFWFIAVPMLYALRFLHRVTGNYGVDIILLTALVRAATIPLTQKSFRSMKDMQKIQPQLKRLQEQYKDDQAKLQKEMMELYRRHGVNPFSGCAPMFLQIPIFVGLYNALMHAIELRHAPFALWIADLSAPERLFVGGIGIPVMTIIMGGTMLVQQWLTPQQGDPTQRQMMMIMPVVFTFMFFNFPAGLVLYWLVSNLLGITQQYLMLRSSK